MIRAALALLRRDLGLSLTRGGGPLLAVGFYLTLMAMIPLSLGPDQAVLTRIAAGLTWLCLALASLLSLERLFERDYEDGVFDLLRLGPLPLELIALLKVISQWLGTGLILSVMTPAVMIILGAAPALAVGGLVAAMLGSLSFALIGGIGASLALGARKGGVLMALLVLPLYAPPVIFGAGLMQAMPGHSATQALAFLAAYALFALAIAPVAMGAALRSALS
ncbi:heme exporter protein CcmB [Asticcacaulis sp. EMRT-3]|uniref:heme exporter protein CcmB n=1 Tax=Asticcacaulis sp. EMRT-3 TaxID=3040349 RepID=UPI0024AF71C0|nr:heme exporter protein CcmB [Asticcacaulis sp. EMRT-3]MDI7775463.1 heme exporter protein CcmB [Asticcacaulis sp. EMRT-3]